MPAYYNEMDKYAAKWLRALVAAGLIPSGDVDERSILDVRAADLAGYGQCHFFAGIGGWPYALSLAGWSGPVWTGSCPCFPAGTLVITERGFVPIEAVVIGDRVLTHRKRFRRVTATGCELSRDCIELRGQAHFGLECTPGHPFFVGNDEWLSAAEMPGHRWAAVIEIPAPKMPELKHHTRGYFWDQHADAFRVKGEKGGRAVYIGLAHTVAEAERLRALAVTDGHLSVRGARGAEPHDLGFAEFLGYWLGDGWTSGNSVIACAGPGDETLLNELWRKARLSGGAYVERTGTRIRCGSRDLAKWLNDNFGKGAASKSIPLWLYGMPEDYRLAFLKGYLTADGHRESGQWRFTTVSRAIAIGVRILLNQLGISASVGFYPATGTKNIQGRTVRQRPWYRITAYDNARSFRFSDGYGWGRVRSARPIGPRPVFNLAVAEDESYTADGIVVHNCQPLSSAGQRRGHADERHLWPAFHALVAECRPSVCFGEQVGGALGREWLAGVRADLEATGYAVGAADLPAAGVGAPHIRQRLFWVADARRRNAAQEREGDSEVDRQRPQEWRRPEQPAGVGAAGRNGNGHLAQGDGGLGDAAKQGRGAQSIRRSATEDLEQRCRSFWADAAWLPCLDGKSRRTQPGLHPLAHGVSARVGRLRAYGNAVVPQAAAAFVSAFTDTQA
jgi:DNA (cytosine-5)-methyltransferase 1